MLSPLFSLSPHFSFQSEAGKVTECNTFPSLNNCCLVTLEGGSYSPICPSGRRREAAWVPAVRMGGGRAGGLGTGGGAQRHGMCAQQTLAG